MFTFYMKFQKLVALTTFESELSPNLNFLL